MMRRALAVACALAMAVAAMAQWQPLRLDSIAPLRAPEGVWRMAPTGTVFEIKARPGRAGAYSLVLVLGPDLTVPSGTEMGSMALTGKDGVYDARLTVDPCTGTQGRERTYTLSLDNEGKRLTVKPYTKKLSVNINRMLPYLFRFSVRTIDTRPTDIDAAYRLAPGPPPGKVVL